jgi:hypothetical protein
MARTAPMAIMREEIRDRLREIADQALGAQRMSIKGDNLCDALDDLDGEVQALIELVGKVRRGEIAGGRQ